MSAVVISITAATAYTNTGGLGIQIPSASDKRKGRRPRRVGSYERPCLEENEVLIMPVTRLYNRQRNFRPTLMLEPRILSPFAVVNADDAAAMGISEREMLSRSSPGNRAFAFEPWSVKKSRRGRWRFPAI